MLRRQWLTFVVDLIWNIPPCPAPWRIPARTMPHGILRVVSRSLVGRSTETCFESSIKLIWIIARRPRGTHQVPGFILDILRRHNILTLATVREDGFPQATTVGYVNDGLTIYIGCGADRRRATSAAAPRFRSRSTTTRRTGIRFRGSRWALRPRSSPIRRRSPILAS